MSEDREILPIDPIITNSGVLGERANAADRTEVTLPPREDPHERWRREENANAILTVFKRRSEIWDSRAEEKAREYLSEMGGLEYVQILRID